MTEGPARPPGRAGARRRSVTALAALLFFFGPALAYAAGERAEQIENRRLPGFPPLSQGLAALPRVNDWATAHLPLRRYAVRGHAAVSQALFGQAPAYGASATGYPRVIEGREGWLYFGDDVSEACRPRRPVAGTVQRLRRLAGIVRRSGRRLVLAVAPDKTTIVPDRLPGRFPGQGCLARRKQELWAALRAAGLPGLLDLRGPLERAQRASGEPAYWRTDSHWTERSAGLFGAELARALDPALGRGTRLVRAGRAPRAGDLGGLLGTDAEEVIDRWRLVREGVYQSGQERQGYPVSFRTRHASTAAPLYREATVIVGDSFTRNSLPWVLPYFADVTYLRSDAPATLGADRFAATVAGAGTVVVEIVERHLAGGRADPLEDAVLDALESALRTPAR
ncbi:hypothetical protein Sru01_39220 [Sphaerisporangium rufum]|uniref:AlgX/AlgJ SGNH hydrolase-like domain-containing protein n=1 Tax=Sphaerisporangium rufum TaxID=1381558 RepID=A0A919R613_9ACTN|nr:hypothetical protein [Sphaerisporangium rufum]GII78940.1 hypothetical protein Sru01_39220 [Sphaerisporangium rufum]